MEERRPNVRRLHPVRVMLALRDRKFARVTSFLLERRGYDVRLEGGSDIGDAATRFRADVVLLEADISRASTAHCLAALGALPTPPGVVALYADDPIEQLPGATSLSKWARIEELARAIDETALRRGAAGRANSSSSSV